MASLSPPDVQGSQSCPAVILDGVCRHATQAQKSVLWVQTDGKSPHPVLRRVVWRTSLTT